MAEILKRWDESTQQWVIVTSINRIEVGGGSSGEWINFITGIDVLNIGFILTNINLPM